MMPSHHPSMLERGWVRIPLTVLALGSTVVWAFTAIDDYLFHTPYLWGQWCGEASLSQVGKDTCKFVYNYYYSLDAHTIDSGVVATVFLLLSLVCLVLLWTPGRGLGQALLLGVLVVGPLEVLLFEIGVYFLMNYWWTVHATEFLDGTPFTNEAIFWLSAVLLCLGVSVEWVLRHRRSHGDERGELAPMGPTARRLEAVCTPLASSASPSTVFRGA